MWSIPDIPKADIIMGKWYQSRDRRYGKNISINDRPWYYVDFFLFVDFEIDNNTWGELMMWETNTNTLYDIYVKEN